MKDGGVLVSSGVNDEFPDCHNMYSPKSVQNTPAYRCEVSDVTTCR